MEKEKEYKKYLQDLLNPLIQGCMYNINTLLCVNCNKEDSESIYDSEDYSIFIESIIQACLRYDISLDFNKKYIHKDISNFKENLERLNVIINTDFPTFYEVNFSNTYQIITSHLLVIIKDFYLVIDKLKAESNKFDIMLKIKHYKKFIFYIIHALANFTVYIADYDNDFDIELFLANVKTFLITSQTVPIEKRSSYNFFENAQTANLIEHHDK